MLRYFTAGESHGEGLVAFLSGIPAGLGIDQAFLNRELWRRQQGFGRGGRMKIETDKAHILSGVRHGKSIGSPISILLENKDWKNWEESLPVEPGDPEKHKRVASPRPGHADLAGALKYNFPEARYILERASARESAARVAIGAIAKLFLRELGIEVLSHVIAVGKATLANAEVPWERLQELHARQEVLLNCADPDSEQRMKAEVDHALRTGDSIGGVFEVVAHNVPPGLGTFAQWDERLDGMLAQAVMSLQAVKAVEIGTGVESALSFGSAVHDEIGYAKNGETKFTGFTRASNHAGGIEGGISNGQDILVRGYLKPISTLRRPLGSVDFATREPVKAAYERSDVCVVPAAGVAAEAMVALTLGALCAGKVWRRFHRRNAKKFCRLSTTIAGVLAERMIYPIVVYGDPVLERPSEPVTEFNAELKKLVDDMFESMYAAHGVGLAAPQIGIGKRIAVIDTTFKEDPKAKLVLVNPEVISREGKQQGQEGCLSLPDFRENVARANIVTVRAQDVEGNWFEKTGDDLLARAFLHEIDHLNGRLFISHVSALKRDLIKRKIKKLVRAGEWA